MNSVEKQELGISIIMPAYNAEKTIAESIQSVINQTYTNWELILINDCSTDKTEEAIDNILSQLPQELFEKIHVIQNEKNSGVSESRNSGVREAKYEWVAFLDSDDLWSRYKLEKQVSVINEKPDASIVFSGSAFINESGQMSKYILHVPFEIKYKELLKQNLISCSSVLVEKNVFMTYQMKHDELHEDYLLWLTILKNRYKAYGIDEPLLIYRLSSHSKSSNKRKAALMTFNVYKKIGLSQIQAAYYMIYYTIRNFKKYTSIRSGF